jgi:hypothetical protein
MSERGMFGRYFKGDRRMLERHFYPVGDIEQVRRGALVVSTWDVVV